MLLTTLLQITTQTNDLGVQTVSEPTATDSITLIDLIMKGGIIMIPIFILSFLAIYIIIERAITIKKATKNTDGLLNQIQPLLKTGDLTRASASLSAYNTPISRMLFKGVQKIGSPLKQIEASMEAVGKVEVMKLEKNMSLLGIIAAIAPMLGFVGTISGVIKIFYNISLADNISIGLIAGGLYEKMVTSAAGLIVGIIAHTGYHYLNMMIENVVLRLETTSLEFIDVISEEK